MYIFANRSTLRRSVGNIWTVDNNGAQPDVSRVYSPVKDVRTVTSGRNFANCPQNPSTRHLLRDYLSADILRLQLSYAELLPCTGAQGWRFGVAVTRWSRSTQLLYIEPG